MLETTDFRSRNVLIFGLGLHSGGLNAARWFLRQAAVVGVTDLRPARELRPSVTPLRGQVRRWTLGRHLVRDIHWADVIVPNPGAVRNPLLGLARRLGKTIVMDVAVFFALCPAPIVGITGTKGKGTTAAFTAAFLRTQYPDTSLVGNIGVGALGQLPYLRAAVPTVFELSSWQLEGLADTGVSPHIALLTNVFPDHLNRYRSFADYVAAKYSIARFQQPGDVAIVNLDNHRSTRLPIQPGVRRLEYALTRRPGASAYCANGKVWLRWRGRPFAVAALKEFALPGDHNRSALLAALLAAAAAGADPRRFRTVIQRLRGLPGRLEVVARRRGVTWINDTTATAPAATVAALKTLRPPITLIAGGQDKRLPVTDLTREIRRRVEHLILLPGTASRRLARALGKRSQARAVATLPEAVRVAARLTSPNGTVVLSPAAASFNQFRDEFHRGDVFVRAVRQTV